MKKNIFSDNRKSSKGFYTALGISAVMIGSACYFAYDQGEKLSEELTAKNSISEDSAVDNKVTDIPKITVAEYHVPTTTPQIYTTPVFEPLEEYEEPVFSEEVPEPQEVFDEVQEQEEEVFYEEPEEVPVNVGMAKLENVKPPLADISNILTVFSGTELVKNETTGSWQTHNGTDISAEVGAEVYSVSNGQVKSIKNDSIWGVTVVIDHYNGFESKYCSLSEDLAVQEGDQLLSGDLIGFVGNTADIESALNPHLHIEIKQNGIYIDPMNVLQ